MFLVDYFEFNHFLNNEYKFSAFQQKNIGCEKQKLSH